MVLTMEDAKAMAHFDIVDKPDGIFNVKRTIYHDLAKACKGLAGDKTIRISLDDTGCKSFTSFRQGLRAIGKKYGLKLYAVQKNGYIFICNR